jgi:hypothetical protein
MLSLASSLLVVCGLAMSIIGLTTVTSPLVDPAADVRSSPAASITRTAISSLAMTQVGGQPVSPVDAPQPDREGESDVLLLRYARLYLLDAAAAARRYPGVGVWSGEARPNAWFFTAPDSAHSTPHSTPPSGPNDGDHPGADGGPRGREVVDTYPSPARAASAATRPAASSCSACTSSLAAPSRRQQPGQAGSRARCSPRVPP